MRVPILTGDATVVSKGKGVYEVSFADGTDSPPVGAVGREAAEVGTTCVLELAMELFLGAQSTVIPDDAVGGTVREIQANYEERAEDLSPIVVELPTGVRFDDLKDMRLALRNRRTGGGNTSEVLDGPLAQLLDTLIAMDPEAKGEGDG